MKLSLACLASASLVAACMPAFKPIDTGKPLTDRDLALSFSKGGNGDADDFSEQLVVRAVMEDEASVYVKLTVTNLASSDGRADLTVNVTLADGRKLRFKERRDRDEWVFGRDRFYAEIGDGSVEVNVGRTHITAKNEEFELDLELTSALPPLRPRGGIFNRGGRFYITTIPIPRGVARAHLKVLAGAEPPPEEAPSELPPPSELPLLEPVEIPDEPAPDGPEGVDLDEPPAEEPGVSQPEELDMEGIGYAEHRAGNVAPYSLARRWYSILDIGEDATVMLSVFEHAQADGVKRDPTAQPEPVQGFFFATADDAIALYEPEIDLKVRGWQADEKTGYPLPLVVFVGDTKHSSFEGVIVAGALSDRKDDLEGLSKLERIVVRKFMKPWTFRFDRARYLFRKQNPGEPMREIRGAERLQVQQLN